jgi:hypothetical protein
VNADPDSHLATVGPGLRGELSLNLCGGVHGVICALERDHEGVALRVDLDPTEPVERGSQESPMLVLNVHIAGAQPA